MENRHEDALRRINQADSGLSRDGREPEAFHLRHPGGMERRIDHPWWDRSWAAPSEHTIDDLGELEYLRVEPHHNKARSFTLTMKGREKATEMAARIIRPAPAEDDVQDMSPGESSSPATAQGSESAEAQRPIFVVHGHGRKDEVARFLQKITGREPVVLSEKPAKGRTIIEKFEDETSDAAYAVVLLTADDLGRGRSEGSDQLRPRARQNAVLELGYFIGRIGRENVAVLYEGDVEIPSDYQGVEYISFTDNWQSGLLRELQSAGIKVDVSAI